MAEEDFDVLEDDDVPENEGAEAGKKSKLPFIIFLIISPIIIFGTVYLSTQMIIQKEAVMQAGDSLALAEAMAADSAIMKADSIGLSADSVATVSEPEPIILKSEEMYTDLEADTEAINVDNQEMQLRILNRFGKMSRLIAQQNSELQEMKILQAERKEMMDEFNQLKNKSDLQEKDIQNLKDDMPARVLKMMQDYQAERDKVVEKSVTEAIITDAEEEAARLKRIAKVSKIYEAMKSDKAAIILAKLKDDEIKDILLKMRQRTAAKILAEFQPRLAARISRLMGEEK